MLQAACDTSTAGAKGFMNSSRIMLLLGRAERGVAHERPEPVAVRTKVYFVSGLGFTCILYSQVMLWCSSTITVQRHDPLFSCVRFPTEMARSKYCTRS